MRKVWKTIGTVLALLLCAVFAFALVCNLTIIIKGTLHPDTPPTVFGVAPMVVLSGSMSGTAQDHIEVGDLIFDTKADVNTLKEGDVISFMENKIVVTHRIIRIETAQDGTRLFVTKGDANNTEDEPITADMVVGLYRFRIPKLGDFALFLQKPLGMVIFIGIPVLAFIVIDILRRQRHKSREARENEQLRMRETARRYLSIGSPQATILRLSTMLPFRGRQCHRARAWLPRLYCGTMQRLVLALRRRKAAGNPDQGGRRGDF